MKKRRPNQKIVKLKEKKLKEALVNEKKEFKKLKISIDKKEKMLRSLFRPMKELGKRRR